MAVSSYVASASLLSDGSGSFSSPPYYNGGFSTGSIQFTHNGGEIERSGTGWGSMAWDAIFGPDSIIGVKIGSLGEFELEIRGTDLGGSNWDAYGLYIDGAGGFELYRTVNATATTLATGSVSVSPGDIVWFVGIDGTGSVELAAAVETGGVVGGDFVTYSDTSGSRLTASGRVGVWANGTAFGADEFYGGTAVAASGTDPGYIVQEDGTSKILLEDGSGALVTETYDPGSPTSIVVDSGVANASGPTFATSARETVDAGSATASGPAITGTASVPATSGSATASGPTVATSAAETVTSGSATASGPTIAGGAAETTTSGTATGSGPDAAAAAAETVQAGSGDASGPDVTLAATETVDAGEADAIGGEITVDGGDVPATAPHALPAGLAYFPDTFPAAWAGESDDEEAVALVLALTLT